MTAEEMEAAMSDEITEAHCNVCGRSTNHDVIAVEKKEGTCEEDDDRWFELYEMLRCRGCESVCLRHIQRRSEARPATTFYYPPAIARRTPIWANPLLFELISDVLVPDPICDLMREVYTAIQNDSRRLAAMGIRAALEGVMIEKVGDNRSFENNMDTFEKAGYLSVRQRGTLEHILEAGHAAMHRGWEPTHNEIATLLDITESIIEEVYLHEHQAECLAKVVPKRPRRVRKSE